MAKKENEAKTNKQKRHFFKDMKAELKKVIWPSAKQTANNTLAVIGFTLILAVIVFVLDLAFDFANKNGVVALQQKIKSSYSSNNTTTQNTTNEENQADTNTSADANKTENATNVQVETKTENSTNTESKK